MGKKRRRGRGRIGGVSLSGAVTFFSAIGLAVCLIGLIGTGPAFVRDVSIRSHGVRSTGTVSEVVEYTTHSKAGSRENYYPVIATSIHGQIRQTSTRAYSVDEAGRFFVGDRVDVVYDARDPSRIVPDWPGAERDLALSFWFIVGVGVVSVVAGIASVVWRRVRRRDRGSRTAAA